MAMKSGIACKATQGEVYAKIRASAWLLGSL